MLAAMATDGASRDETTEADASAEEGPSIAESLDPGRVAELVRAGDARLVDVRQPEEWEAARIDGAVHIVLEEVSARASEIPRDAAVVFACRGGSRSAMVADAFRGDGYDAYNMAGGVRAWEEAGLPLTGSEGSVS